MFEGMNMEHESAFPFSDVAEKSTGGTIVYTSGCGMSLRDYFAAKALQGFASDPDCDCSVSLIAKIAYEWADAMLEARK
jgi:hypothetical protein